MISYYRKVTEMTKNSISFLSHFCILGHHHPLPALETSFSLKVWPCRDIGASPHSVVGVHVNLAFALNFAELPHVMGPLKFCAQEAS